MDFKEHLRRAVDQTPGALLCTLMGNDGIAIDTYETERSVERDILTATVELTGLMTQVRQSTQGLKSGDLRELTVAGDTLTAIVRPVTPEYFLALVVDADGWAGKGRHLLRVIAPKLVSELS
jgi:predicted regulator of Ras-like GTPase activity (Roadblock/LC7/MglB family)